MPTRLSILTQGGRLALGLICTAAAVAVTTAALTVPLPTRAAHPPVHTVTPVPAAEQRVCPGPLLALGADADKAQVAESFGGPGIVSGSLDGTAIGQKTTSTDLKSGAHGSGSPVTIAAKATGSTAELAAAQSQQANREDLAGLAAASCEDPSADSWLVAGSTTLGQTSLLLLANPTEVDAEVSLTVWGAKGRIASDSDTGIVVPARSQKVIPLAGIAPNVAAPVVHVHSQGGTVAATMQQSFVRGLAPLGVELASAGVSPRTTQRIPGVMVRTLKDLQGAQAGDGYGVDLPAVRVLNPGKTATQVTIGAVGEVSTKAGNTFTVTAQPGVVTEVPLKDLPDGDYTLTVGSQHPVVAAARTATLGTGGEDFAWFPSASGLATTFSVAVAQGPTPRLHVVNPGTADATFTIRSASGVETTLTVVGGGAASAPLTAGEVYSVSGMKGAIASVGYAGDGALSSYPISPRTALASPIRVYTG